MLSRSKNPLLVTGAVVKPTNQFEAYRSNYQENGNLILASQQEGYEKDLDVSWLKAASETYHISADLNDYVLVDVPLVTVPLPNMNMQAFPYEEASYFDPHYGKLIYETFDRKPTHIDHDNEDPTQAKGVIFDVAMEAIPKYGVWKIKVLTGWDRSKDEQLVNAILKKLRDAYSMGAMVGYFLCSICGQSKFPHACEHLSKQKGDVIQTSTGNRLVYEVCTQVNYIECSSVDAPADFSAVSDMVWE